MPSSRVTRRHLPALLLVLFGLALVGFSGFTVAELSRTQYDYAIHGIDAEERGIYEFDDLSPGAQNATRAALNGSEDSLRLSNRTAVPEFDDDRRLYVRDGGTDHCIDTERIDGEWVVSAPDDCPSTGGPVVHDFETLSDAGRNVVGRALDAPDGRVSVHGPSPPEFESGGDAPTLNDGRYYVERNGSYYELWVNRQGGLGVGMLVAMLSAVALGGLLLVVAGVTSFRRPAVALPTAVVAGLAVAALPVILRWVGILDGDGFGDTVLLFGGVGVVTAGGVWALVRRRGE